MIIKLTLNKNTLENFNYIDDNGNYLTKTSLIKDLIDKEANRLRIIKGESIQSGSSYSRKAICHPAKTHYAKGLCRSCYVNKRNK